MQVKPRQFLSLAVLPHAGASYYGLKRLLRSNEGLVNRLTNVPGADRME